MAIKESAEIAAALNAQVEAAQHIRDCAPCHRLFRAAYEAAYQQFSLPVSDRFPWSITNKLLPELRECENWPKGV